MVGRVAGAPRWVGAPPPTHVTISLLGGVIRRTWSLGRGDADVRARRGVEDADRRLVLRALHHRLDAEVLEVVRVLQRVLELALGRGLIVGDLLGLTGLAHLGVVVVGRDDGELDRVAHRLGLAVEVRPAEVLGAELPVQVLLEGRGDRLLEVRERADLGVLVVDLDHGGLVADDGVAVVLPGLVLEGGLDLRQHARLEHVEPAALLAALAHVAAVLVADLLVELAERPALEVRPGRTVLVLAAVHVVGQGVQLERHADLVVDQEVVLAGHADVALDVGAVHVANDQTALAGRELHDVVVDRPVGGAGLDDLLERVALHGARRVVQADRAGVNLSGRAGRQADDGEHARGGDAGETSDGLLAGQSSHD